MCVAVTDGRKENIMENAIAYVDYSERVRIDYDALIVVMWNAFVEYRGGYDKVFVNDKDFFEKSFDTAFAAVHAVSLSGNYTWSDDYVYFDSNGYIASFNHWDDANSPIDPGRIDINDLARDIKKLKNGYVVNNIPKAIHDALS